MLGERLQDLWSPNLTIVVSLILLPFIFAGYGQPPMQGGKQVLLFSSILTTSAACSVY